mmetsp:Transcript_114313/g.355972  ORF Transcript_114313/g.355972 Transcript_114313/m.355972 type:complete len:204 (-) Transcript_114313:681-1292(-)
MAPATSHQNSTPTVKDMTILFGSAWSGAAPGGSSSAECTGACSGPEAKRATSAGRSPSLMCSSGSASVCPGRASEEPWPAVGASIEKCSRTAWVELDPCALPTVASRRTSPDRWCSFSLFFRNAAASDTAVRKLVRLQLLVSGLDQLTAPSPAETQTDSGRPAHSSTSSFEQKRTWGTDVSGDGSSAPGTSTLRSRHCWRKSW